MSAQSGGGQSGFSRWIRKRMTDLDLRLPLAPLIAALVSMVLAFLYAPHSPSRLGGFFGAVAAVLATIGVGLLLFQSKWTARVKRFLGAMTVGYFVVGILGALGGLLPLPHEALRWILVLVVACGVGAMLTFALVTITWLRESARRAREERLNGLGS